MLRGNYVIAFLSESVLIYYIKKLFPTEGVLVESKRILLLILQFIYFETLSIQHTSVDCCYSITSRGVTLGFSRYLQLLGWAMVVVPAVTVIV